MDRLDPPWIPGFLAALRAAPNVSEAARAVGITRQAAYARRDADPAFAAAWDDAIEESTDRLVGECYRRAVEGTIEEVYHQGEVCGHRRRYSDQLAITLLKAHRPRVYGDRIRHDLDDIARLSDAELLARIAGALGGGRAAGADPGRQGEPEFDE